MKEIDKQALEAAIMHDEQFRDFVVDCRLAFSGKPQ